MKFAFLLAADSVHHINNSLAEPVSTVGVHEYNNREQVLRFGTQDVHYEWVGDCTCRNEFDRLISSAGLTTSWIKTRLELSGPRGMEFAPMDLNSVYGHRWTLTVSVPAAEPATKRRKLHSDLPSSK